MTSHCYVSRTSLRSALLGPVIALGDGVQRIIPDPWFRQAELLREGRLLRLHYTFCVIEIAGQKLGAIFEDASAGHLGFLQAAHGEPKPEGELWITGITVIEAASQSAFSSAPGSSE
jgi:hypothetical protein